MATITKIRNRFKKSDVQQRAERLKATAAAMSADVEADRADRAERLEKQRNGVKVPKGDTSNITSNKACKPARRLDVDLPGLAISARVTTGKPDFRSAPNARQMTQRDIQNIQMLTREDAKELLDAIEAVAPEIVARVKQQIDRDWDTMLDASERFTLTALGCRKAAREQGVRLKTK